MGEYLRVSTTFIDKLPENLKDEFKPFQQMAAKKSTSKSRDNLKSRVLLRIIKTHQLIAENSGLFLGLSAGIEKIIPVELKEGATKWLIKNNHWPFKDVNLDETLVLARIPRDPEADMIEVNIFDDPDRAMEFVLMPIEFIRLIDESQWDKTKLRPWEAETS